MSKLKTHKSLAKRVKRTKRGKFIHRKGGQDHFNAHETGKKKRNKKRDVTSAKTESRNIKNLLPYS